MKTASYKDWRLFYNGDLSGDVELRKFEPEKDCGECGRPIPQEPTLEVNFPGELIRDVGERVFVKPDKLKKILKLFIEGEGASELETLYREVMGEDEEAS